jgi:hypothetical protein
MGVYATGGYWATYCAVDLENDQEVQEQSKIDLAEDSWAIERRWDCPTPQEPAETIRRGNWIQTMKFSPKAPNGMSSPIGDTITAQCSCWYATPIIPSRSDSQPAMRVRRQASARQLAECRKCRGGKWAISDKNRAQPRRQQQALEMGLNAQSPVIARASSGSTHKVIHTYKRYDTVDDAELIYNFQYCNMEEIVQKFYTQCSLEVAYSVTF